MGTIIFIALIVVGIIGKFKLFKKCGEKGWKVFVPVYNHYIFGKIGGCGWLGIIYGITKIAYIILALFILVMFALLALGTIMAFTIGVAALVSAPPMDKMDGIANYFENIAIFLNGNYNLVYVLTGIGTALLVMRTIMGVFFNSKTNTNMWWILGWMFIPRITLAIMGMSKMQFNIEKKVDQNVEVIDNK